MTLIGTSGTMSEPFLIERINVSFNISPITALPGLGGAKTYTPSTGSPLLIREKAYRYALAAPREPSDEYRHISLLTL